MRNVLASCLIVVATMACSSSGGEETSDTGADGGSGEAGGPTNGSPTCEEVPQAGGAAPTFDVIPMPGGETGIGFDDLIYSSRLERVVVPGGWTGRVNLVQPETLEVTSIEGFSQEASWTEGDDLSGVGCVDEGNGLVFVGDRTTSEIGVVDPATQAIRTKVALAGYPDYMRYVEATGEVWVGQPFANQIEVLTGAKDGDPVHDAVIPVTGGPEAMVVDQSRGIVFVMRLFMGEVVAFDARTRQEIGTWQTGCSGSHGLVAVDEEHGYVFPGCLEQGRVAVLDVNADGATLDTFQLGGGSTLVAFAPALRHFYMRGDPGTPLAVLRVGDDGTLTHLSTFDVTFGDAQKEQKAHCLAADDRGGIWTCDWYSGTILRYADPHASCSD